MKKKVVITGGHHNSALVVAKKLRKKGWDVIWFGHKFTMLGDQHPSAEFREVTQAGFEFVQIEAGKLSRKNKLVHFFRLFYGFGQAFYYLFKYRPGLIISFGGYLALPVVICGQIFGIPSVTHEQTTVSGLSNRVIAFFAKKVFVSWPMSRDHFPLKKTDLTGLPLRLELFEQKEKLDFGNALPTIYVTGGKQGSHVINQIVKKITPELLDSFNLIHQCGSSTVHDDYDELKKMKKNLPLKKQKRYRVKDYFFQNEIGKVFNTADLLVSRAGAHIVYEIAALGKLAIFIPIPWSRANEQYKNAQMLVDAGTARILSQNNLDQENLLGLIKNMFKEINVYKKNTKKAKKLVKKDAAKLIVDSIESL